MTVDGTVTIYDMTRNAIVFQRKIHNQPFSGAAFGESENELRLVSEDGHLLLVQFGGDVLVQTVSRFENEITAFDYSRKSSAAVFGDEGGAVVLTSKVHPDHKSLRLPSGTPVIDAKFSPSGDALAWATTDSEVVIKSLIPSAPEIRLPHSSGSVPSLSFSNDGRLLATVAGNETVRLWDPFSGHVILELRVPGSFLKAVAFSPMKKQLAVVGHLNQGGVIHVWSVGEE
jgi:WD40 repeat protein